MPNFTFVCDDPPINYADPFRSLWMFLLLLGRRADARDEFDFEKHQAYQELKRYLRSEPYVASVVFPPDQHESVFSSGLRTFLEHAIDRYIHLTGHTFFDADRFLEIYLPLEAGLLWEELPIEIHTPILLVSLPSDSYELEGAVSITRISEPMQLARARRDHDTHDVNEYLLQQASHALVLRDHVLPNSEYRQRYAGYSVSASTLDIIDTFFACLRIITSIETGYAQVLFVPVGWAHSYAASLPSLCGLTTRKYPPTLQPVSVLTGDEFPKISDLQIAGVRNLFRALISAKNTDEGSRLRLVIKRLNSCYMREDQEDAILDATIGLEILLSDGDTQEVTHKLALRLAALSTIVPGCEQQAANVFRNVKKAIYPFRSAVVHGNEKKASKTRQVKTGTGKAIAAVKLAIDYLGMAIRAVAAHPEYLNPAAIDDELLLGRAAVRSLGAADMPEK
jgi:hypothetical protein